MAGTLPSVDAAKEALLEAAEALIRERGWPQTTPLDVATRAASSLGEFQKHFADRSALLMALNDRHVLRIIATIDESTRSGIWSTASSAQVIEVAVRSILDAILDNAELTRAFMTHGATNPAWVSRVNLIGEYLTERLQAVLAKHDDWTPSSERALAFSLFLTASLAYNVAIGNERWSGIAFSREELAVEQTRAVLGYLGLRTTR